MNAAELLARRFHDTYEKLAPQFGYETRGDTRVFDPESANGKLMIAVSQELLQEPFQKMEALLWEMHDAANMAKTDPDDPPFEVGPTIENWCDRLMALLATPSIPALAELERFSLEDGNDHHPAMMESIENGDYVRYQDVETLVKRITLAFIGTDPNEMMVDSVRYLLVGMQTPGVTFGGIRKHCEMSGMDTSHWPSWATDPNLAKEHLNKSARASLIWHCMAHAALYGYKDA